MPELLKNYVETGKVRYVVRDYPLGFHKYAAKAHEAAHCAREQDRYWEMHEQLFANQKALQLENLPGYAESAGVADLAAFSACLESGQYAERGRKSLADGAKAGVSGTPSFLIGVMQPDGTVKATKFIRGAQRYPVFDDAIKEVLSASES
jgi:protein-disulfide isomerase